MTMTITDLAKLSLEPPRYIKSNGDVAVLMSPVDKAKKPTPVFASEGEPPLRLAGRPFNPRLTQSRLVPPVVAEPEPVVLPEPVVDRPRREVKRPRLFGAVEEVEEEDRQRYKLLKITQIRFEAERGRVVYRAKVEGKATPVSLSAKVVCKNGGKDLIRAFHRSHTCVEMPECVRALLE